MSEQVTDKPGFGFVPKLIVVALAAIGAIALVQWVLGWIFGAVKIALVLGIVVLVIWAIVKLGGRGDD